MLMNKSPTRGGGGGGGGGVCDTLILPSENGRQSS